jgi:hypothetical protein
METRQTRVYKTRSLSPSVSPTAIYLKGKRNGNEIKKQDSIQQVVSPSPQADPWTVYVQSKLVELEAAKASSDRKWGENRLITLVDSQLREKFWIQNGRLHQAIGARDHAKFDSSLAGMIRAYGVGSMG